MATEAVVPVGAFAGGALGLWHNPVARTPYSPT